MVYAAEAQDRRAILQVVGRRADLTLHDEWGKRRLQTQIVAIGAPDSIVARALSEQFEACIA